MSPRLRTGLSILAALVVGSLILLGSMRVVERGQTAGEINRIREELYRARLSSDRCRGSLQTSQASLRTLSVIIDSMKIRVDSFETADGLGVPAARYDEYMDLFDSYNDSVTVWGRREQRLRTSETSCRSTIEAHNALSDSLQSVLINAGIEAN